VNIVTKAVAGDRVRRTRLHTEGGMPCALGGLRGVFPSAWTWMHSRITGRYANQPWWVWEAARFVERNLRASDRVLEAGSGYSTLWLAGRASMVVSIEELSVWREKVGREAQRRGTSNVFLHAGRSGAVFRELFDADRWDVVVIDSPRDRLPIFRRIAGGATLELPRLVIFDDTDRAENRAALRLAGDFDAHCFRGFKPQTLHACETTVFVRRPLSARPPA
jgi:hypothetical protein